MQAAAPKTYISRRMLDRYSQERRLQQESKESSKESSTKTAPVVPPKVFSEDDHQTESAEATTEQTTVPSTNLAPIEEEKQELEETKETLVAGAKNKTKSKSKSKGGIFTSSLDRLRSIIGSKTKTAKEAPKEKSKPKLQAAATATDATRIKP